MKQVAVDILKNTSFIDGLFVGSSGFFLLVVKNHMVRWASCMFFLRERTVVPQEIYILVKTEKYYC